MEHSKTPWRIGAMESGQVVIDDADGQEVTGWISTDDGARIVACVNACAGISTDNLEQNLPVIELARQYNTVLQQRDQLLAALERAVSEAVADDLDDWFAFARATIAKVKGND